MPKLFRVLKSNGSLLVLCMAWLPFEDEIAGASERLVLKYNPSWSGAGEPMPPIEIPACHTEKFDLVYHDEYSLQVPWQLEWANESAPGYRRFPYQCRNPSVRTGTQKVP